MQLSSKFFGHIDAAAYNHNIDVGRGTAQKVVTHIAANDIGSDAFLVGDFGYLVKYF